MSAGPCEGEDLPLGRPGRARPASDDGQPRGHRHTKIVLDSVELLPSWSMVVYPATEQQVFPVRVAAFYGNIFDPAGLNTRRA